MLEEFLLTSSDKIFNPDFSSFSDLLSLVSMMTLQVPKATLFTMPSGVDQEEGVSTTKTSATLTVFGLS